MNKIQEIEHVLILNNVKYEKYPDCFDILLCADCTGCGDWMPC